MRLEISDLKVTLEADVKSTMMSGYYLDSVKVIIHVTINSETNKEKALRCGKFVASYGFSIRALEKGTKVDLVTDVKVKPN
jgi:hypothetical protein